MAKLRSVNTHFWQDDYICELPADQKLLFLYFLTCPLSNIAGVYEITRRQICFDTGLNPQQLTEGLTKFISDGKVRYEDNYLMMVNHHKNQKLNPSMEKARRMIINDLPRHIQAIYKGFYEQDADTMRQDEDRMPSSCLQYKDKDKDKDKDKEEVEDKLKIRHTRFLSEIFIDEYLMLYGKPMLQAFALYWTELNASRTKMRFELQQTWMISRRLATWAAREPVVARKDKPVLFSYIQIQHKVQNEGKEVWDNYRAIKRGDKTFWVHKSDYDKLNPEDDENKENFKSEQA